SVNRVFDYPVEGAREGSLVHIVLILPYTNSLGVNFDQLCQWILKASRNGYGTTQRYIHVWELIGSYLRSRIVRGPRFRSHHGSRTVAARVRQQLSHLNVQLVRLARGSSVANRQKLNAMLRAHLR